MLQQKQSYRGIIVIYALYNLGYSHSHRMILETNNKKMNVVMVDI